MRVVPLSLLICGWAAMAGGAAAEEPDFEFFEKKIRPVLAAHCYECHSADARKLGGGLRLDHREGVLQGGESGPAVIPGQPDRSLLVKALRYDDLIQMPPQGKLPPHVIADVETWVRQGAPDPRKGSPPPAGASWEDVFRTRRDWWSLKPVRLPTIPTPRDAGWSVDPIDRFVLAQLEEHGLTPAADAEPETLARRLSLVLIGLPPSPEQVAAFVAEWTAAPRPADVRSGTAGARCPETAVARYVDALLASPHFGERWARHWMDVVRFTETHGNEWNYEVHHAWRYRDYLIRAFNEDVPFDQLIREHVAGDLLPRPRWNAVEQCNESVIGTAFFRFGEVNHDDCIGLRSIGYDIADNQIDTLTKAFQALTVACARCHHHKLDPIAMEDYYALLGVLRSSRMVSHCLDGPDANAPALARLRALKRELRPKLASRWRQDVLEFPRYMQAAHSRQLKLPDAEQLAHGLNAERLDQWVAVLRNEKLPLEDALFAWRTLTTAASAAPESFSAEWQKLADTLLREHHQRTEFHATHFTTWADFRRGTPPGWDLGGQGLREAAGGSGDFVLELEGQRMVRTLLPAGCFTHRLSDKLNGTLRSPVLPAGKQHIAFRVLGECSSAVRLVSNNCQLNYKNYRALTSGDWQWISFSPPEDREHLRTYAELMTKFDNPKFPDQLSALGGDTANYRIPWDKAAEDPRSYFGITQVVLYDGAEAPRPELAHLLPLWEAPPPRSFAEAVERYAAVTLAALDAWETERATDADVCWLNAFLHKALLSNDLSQAPDAAELLGEYRRCEAQLTLPRIVPGVADAGPGIEQPVFQRGDWERPGPPVPRRFLAALAPACEPFSEEGSGRRELAECLANPANPLTARVMVNRIWHHLFGTGLVRTVDDFGRMGELPSHPELLDYLAARFVEEGWSIKRLIRTVVLTRTFQLSHQPSGRAREVDPLNRLLQHYPARRMEAEAIRDALLVVSGRLDDRLYGLSIHPFRDQEYADRRLFPGPLDGAGRRSIYIKNNLMEAPRFLGVFNVPGGKVTQGRRDLTSVPAQALALLNDPFVVQQAGEWASRLAARHDDEVAHRLTTMFHTALGRRPQTDELARFERVMWQLAEFHQVAAAEILSSRDVWKDLAHSLLIMQEFLEIP